MKYYCLTYIVMTVTSSCNNEYAKCVISSQFNLQLFDHYLRNSTTVNCYMLHYAIENEDTVLLIVIITECRISRAISMMK